MNSFIAEIDKALREGGDRMAFVQADQGLTCRDADQMVGAFHEWIREHCQPGDRVAALTQNRVEAVLLEWAAYRAGCIWLGIPARERDAGNLARLLADFTPRLLVLERFGPYGAIGFQAHHFPAEEISAPEGIEPHRFRVLLRSDREDKVEFRVGVEPIRRLRYSSGTAGEPKAVAYTDRTLEAMLQMIRDKVLEGRAWTVVHGLPITWASGSLIAPALCEGGKNVILESWGAERFASEVARDENVLSLLTPGLLAGLTRYSKTSGAGWVRGLRRVLLAGGPTPVWTMRRARKDFSQGTEFIVTLGQTEASFPITWHPVVEEDFEDREEGRSVLPLGPFTDYYQESRVDPDSREILLQGEAVAPARWIPGEGDEAGRFGEFPKDRGLHRTGDRAVTEGGVLHYLGRVSDPWGSDASLPAAEALEAVVNECPGVRRSRVDSLEDVGDVIRAEVTVQPMLNSVQVSRVRNFFDGHKREARLGSVSLERLLIGEVEVTMSGKIRRSGPPTGRTGPAGGGAPSTPAGPGGAAPPGDAVHSSGAFGTSKLLESTNWREFDFPRIASGPLYFYVGAGLSMAAGLVGWSEMACLIWIYRKAFEGKDFPPCPDNTSKGIEEFLDRFVRERIQGNLPDSPRILSRSAGQSPAERRTLGRVALLNMLLRYRGPRRFLKPGGGSAVVDFDQEKQARERPGEEPSQEDLMVHSMIWRSRCHGVFTTNYDMLLEHAFSLFHHGAALRTYRYKADFLRFILSNPHFVLKLHGDINDIATMEFCPRRAWRKGRLSGSRGRGRDLERAYNAALNRGHMIYLGCGFQDATIRRLHRSWKFEDRSSPYCRIALLRDKELTAIRLPPGHGIELLSFREFPEVREFMKEVVSARSGARDRWSPCPEATDLHRQLFLGWDPTAARWSFSTEPWSCLGVARELTDG